MSSSQGNYFLQSFKTPGVEPAEGDVHKLSQQIAEWRNNLPPEMQPQIFQEWTEDNMWTLVLLAMAFRLEAIFCRSAREYYKANHNTAAMHQSSQRQDQAMFELSKVIQTASMHELLHLCPLSL